MTNPAKENPNAIVGGGSGVGGGLLVVWALQLAGVEVDGYTGATIAGSLGAAALLIGRRGLKGILHLVWRGHETDPPDR